MITLSPKETSKYEKSITINVSATVFTDNTVSSMTYKLDGGSEQSVTNNQIVINTDGEHTIEVTVTDNKGYTTTITSGTYKIDNTPPTITFAEGDAGIRLRASKVEGYDLKTGVTLTDNNEISIDDVKTNGNLSEVINEYKIIYTVTDEAGNQTIKERKFNVTAECDTYIMGKNITSGEVVC